MAEEGQEDSEFEGVRFVHGGNSPHSLPVLQKPLSCGQGSRITVRRHETWLIYYLVTASSPSSYDTIRKI